MSIRDEYITSILFCAERLAEFDANRDFHMDVNTEATERLYKIGKIISRKFSTINHGFLEELTEGTLSFLERSSADISKYIEKIESVVREEQPSKAGWDEISKNFITFMEDELRKIEPIVTTLELGTLKRNFENINVDARINDLVNASKNKISKYLNDLEGNSKKTTEILRSIEDATAKAGTIKYAERFDLAARDARKNARNWAIVGVILIVLLAVLSLLWPIRIYENMFDTFMKYVLQRGIIILLMLSAIFFSFKMYRINFNQYIVNSHRETALRSYLAFVNEIDADSSVKSAMLSEVIRTIFTASPTGLIGQAASEHSDTRILEIFRANE